MKDITYLDLYNNDSNDNCLKPLSEMEQVTFFRFVRGSLFGLEK